MSPDQTMLYAAASARRLTAARSRPELYQLIVDAPFHDRLAATQLGLGIVVLLLTNRQTATLDRIALSRTEQASQVLDISVKKFEDIKIPLNAGENILIQVIRTGEFRIVTDWKYMFIPALTPEEARLNQAGAAIACSVAYPLVADAPSTAKQQSAFGALIFSYFEPMSKLTSNHHRFMSKYTDAAAAALTKLVPAS